MELVAKDPNRDKVTLSFENLRVVDGILTGRVYDAKRRYSTLRGSCFSFGPVAQMAFFFTAVNDKGESIDIVLSGGGFQLPGEQPRFTGRFEVFAPAPQGQSAVVNFDEGDTGTGAGMQAQAQPNKM
jgi:hypothetical protein